MLDDSEVGLTLSNYDNVEYGHGDSQGHQRRRADYLFILLLVLACLMASVAVAIAAVVLFSTIIGFPLAEYLPYFDRLPPNRQIFAGMVALLLIAFTFFVIARWRLRRNQSYQFNNGCPSCKQHDLIRVHRRQYQRVLAKMFRIPLRNYACRNCQWHGTLLYSPAEIAFAENPNQVFEFEEVVIAGDGNFKVDEVFGEGQALVAAEPEDIPMVGRGNTELGEVLEEEHSLPVTEPEESAIVSGEDGLVIGAAVAKKEIHAEEHPPLIDETNRKSMADEEVTEEEVLPDDEGAEAVIELSPTHLTETVVDYDDENDLDDKQVLVDPLLVHGSEGDFVSRAIVVAPYGLSLRSAPDKDAEIILSLEPNSVVDVIDLDGVDSPANWRRISFEGQMGWVSAAFLRHLHG